MSLPVPAPERLRALRRMKANATGLLLVAAAVFVVCVTVGDGHGLWGYVQAAAEASMVGGLADWFAVTALFRHPMGIPIPHTAIIPRKKDQLGAALGGFVQQHFLTASVVGEHVAQAGVPRRIGEWLAVPDNAARVADEFAAALGGIGSFVRDDEIRAAVAAYAEKRLRSADVAPLLSRILIAVCESGQHQVALTAGLRGLMRFLDDNRPIFRQRLAEESPEWVPEWVDDRVFAKLFSGLQSFLADVMANDSHELRQQFDRRLRDYATALRVDPAKAASIDAAKLQLLDHPEVREWLSTLWTHLKGAVLAGAADPGSELRRTVQSLTVQVGTALRDDPSLQAKFESVLQRMVSHVAARYGSDIAALISTTVARWDAEETGRRLELQVGRDLQFIRINGTVVGALVGILIHAISQLI
ncbi:MAG TPA: DUF445 domain-containing protein [Jatrophihabitantaceae bacterium]|jgi:uncharacterized membrane-anchored protein YjiN (DUF445 family)|nr:DUF445 domain-containing protein [Jatrophihabitantaceae bacterium]